MRSYKQYITEMSDEVNKFNQIRRKIIESKTCEQLNVACNLFISYNKLYGDKELANRLKSIMSKDYCANEYLLNKARKKVVRLFNWYNKRRSAPQDINECKMIKIAD